MPCDAALYQAKVESLPPARGGAFALETISVYTLEEEKSKSLNARRASHQGWSISVLHALGEAAVGFAVLSR